MSDKPGHTDRPLAWVAAAEDPPPAPASVDVALDALHDALQRGQVDAVIDAGLGAARAGVSPERLAAVVVGCALDRDPVDGWQICLPLVDALRAGQTQEGLRRWWPVLQVATVVAEWASPAAAPVPASTGTAGEASPAEVLRLLTERCVDAGQLAAPVLAAMELAEICGSSLDGRVVGAMQRAVSSATAADHPDVAAHRTWLATVDPHLQGAWQAADEARAASFHDEKFRRHLVDGQGDASWRAMMKALAYGIPGDVLARSLCLAAAERVLRFDAGQDDALTIAEGWPTMAALLGHVSAVRRLRRLIGDASWLRLLLHATWRVQAAAPLDAPPSQRYALPDPEALRKTWDHGPEVARVASRTVSRDTDGAIASMRGYLLMVLPENPLTDQLREVSFLDLGATPDAQLAVAAALSAAIDDFHALGNHPHRERSLAAALRITTCWRGRRVAHGLALAAIDRLELGNRPVAKTALA